MTRHITHSITRAIAGALAALTFAATTAEALDLRAWDQRIDQASKRFVVLQAFDDEAVLDKETQLVWQRTAAQVPFFTRDDAAGMTDNDAACFNADTGGRRGWRLPSIHELNSLVVNQRLPAGHPFLNVHIDDSDLYWSATVRLTDPTVALGLTFSGAGHHPLRQLPAGTSARVWCVRGPGADSTSF
jgi:hypothetical protein